MKLECWSRSDIGKVRKSNQDTVDCRPESGLFIVADGMGGMAEGEVASRMAAQIIGEQLSTPPPPPRTNDSTTQRILRALLRRPANDGAPDPTHELQAAVELANHRIYAANRERSSSPERQMGTTVIVLRCQLGSQRAFWGWVGDSRLYRLRQGRLALLTADHTAHGESYQGGGVVPTDLPHTNRLLRALGVEAQVRVSTAGGELRSGDSFLLCSDGISGMLGPNEIEAQLSADGPVAEIGESLLQQALAAGGRDNASVVLVRLLAD